MKAPWYRRPAATPPLRGAAMVVIVMIVALVTELHKGRCPQKKRENVGIFPKLGTPHPLPPVWEFFPDFTVYFWEVSHVKNSKKMDVGFG